MNNLNVSVHTSSPYPFFQTVKESEKLTAQGKPYYNVTLCHNGKVEAGDTISGLPDLPTLEIEEVSDRPHAGIFSAYDIEALPLDEDGEKQKPAHKLTVVDPELNKELQNKNRLYTCVCKLVLT